MIKILGHQYEHLLDDKMSPRSNSAGNCCANLTEITTDPTLPITRQEEALLHEIFEALRYHLDCQKEFSHKTMSVVCEGLYAVLKDNPQYFTIRIPIKKEATEVIYHYPGSINNFKGE